MNRTLDYVPRLDERNRAYRIRLGTSDGDLDLAAQLAATSRYWTPGYPVLDQAAEGACVGFGCTGEAMASPVRVRPAKGWEGHEAEAGQIVARGVYRRAKEIDEWEGVDYEGTSVRAGMLVGRERGWWSGFRWAFNLLELRAALEEGPVVVGVEWRDGMYDAPDGWLYPTGRVVGGHCLLVTGYSARYQSYRLRNSWGPGWGNNGSAYISDGGLDLILFQAGGEAAVVTGRAL